MPDWVPIKQQLDILRMDLQYTLREVVRKTDEAKVWRSKQGDLLAWTLNQYGLITPFADELPAYPDTAIWVVTKFGRKIVDNDHALREVAMDYMDLLTEDQLHVLQHDMTAWPYRDPRLREFMQELAGVDGGPTLGDFFPQAPWYYHTVGPRNVPRALRDLEEEHLYVQGGYTGNETSAWDIAHGGD